MDSVIDVIVPCYGYGSFLRECVNSVLGQSLREVRVLIIDDASPDNTAEVAADLSAEDQRVAFIRHPSNKGHIHTYNEGIEWAQAEYSLLLSADDYLLPGSLRRATELLDAHPEAGLAFGSSLELSDGGATSVATLANSAIRNTLEGRAWRVLTGPAFFQLVESNAALNIVPTPTAVVRTRLQKTLGGYRPDLPHAGDLEMWLRLAAHSAVCVIGDYQAVGRMHGDNMHKQYYREQRLPDLQQRLAAFDSVFESCGHLLPDCNTLQQRLLRLLAIEALGRASSAFNDGDTHLCQRLSEFALHLDPAVAHSGRWMVVKAKQWMGLRLCRTLLPAAGRVRQLMDRRPSKQLSAISDYVR